MTSEKALSIPDWAKDFTADGIEDIKIEHVKRPYLKVIQKSSGEFDLNPANLGKIMNTSSGEFFTSLSISILKIMPSVWKKFGQKDGKENQLLGTSTDGVMWNTGERLTEEDKWKTRFDDMFVIVKGESVPCILSFSKTSSKAGKGLRNMLASFVTAKREPMYLRNYTISTSSVAGKKGTSYVLNVSLNEGFNSQQECLVYKEMRASLVDIDMYEPAGDTHGSDDHLESADASFSDEPLEID